MYDFVIIGGGIIGMSTAMQLIDVYPDARIALLEKESGPACHQTGHNSGVIHAGVYYAGCHVRSRNGTDARLMGTHSGERYRARMA